MLPTHSKKALAALKRLNGLNKKVEQLLQQEDGNCPETLRNVLAMKGHLDHVQALILESHLYTCAPKKLSKGASKKEFIEELIKVIGLSTR